MLTVPTRRTASFALTGVILAVGVSLAVVYRTQVLCQVGIWRLESLSQHLDVVPVGLDIPGDDGSRPRRFAHFGCEFSLPWNDVNKEEERSTLAYASTPDGRAVFLNDPAAVSPLTALRGRLDPGNARLFAELMGSEATESDFEMLKAIVNATPRSFSFRLDTRESVKLLTLLGLKSGLLFEEGVTGIYSFETPALRGFQVGQPGRARKIQVLAFHGSLPVEIYIRSAEGVPSSLTQSDVNVILRTFDCAPRAAKRECPRAATCPTGAG